MKPLGVIPYLLVARDPYSDRSRYLDPKVLSSSFGAFFPADNIKVAWSNNSSTLFTPPINANYTTQIQAIGTTIKSQIPESILTVTDKKSRKFSINKIDEAKEGLVGATFTLSKRTTVAADHQVQGDFIPVSKETTVGRTTLTFDNLKPGFYDLKETKAPNAYVLDPKTYVVVVQNSGKTTIVDEANFKEADYPMADNTSHVETVALLSKLDVDKHINIEIELDELDLTSAECKATYAQIKEYVWNKFELKVSTLYIAQIKRKCGIELREHYNKSKKEKQIIPQCTPEKEEAIMDALRHFKMIG